MKKLAIILVAKPGMGKSTTLIKYVKPEFNVRGTAHIFSYNGYTGYIKTQSLQETDKTLQELEKFEKYDVFVLASHPPKSKGTPKLEKILKKLKKLGFKPSKKFLESKRNKSEQKKIGKEIVKSIRDHINNLPRSSSH